jgi:hypothetical protein
MSTKARKVILEAPNPLRRRMNSNDTDGNESVNNIYYVAKFARRHAFIIISVS